MSEEEGERPGYEETSYTPNEVVLRELIYPSAYIESDPDLARLKEFVDRVLARSILRDKKDVQWIHIQFDIITTLELMGAKQASKIEKIRLLNYVITKSALGGELVKLGVAPQLLNHTQKKRRFI